MTSIDGFRTFLGGIGLEDRAIDALEREYARLAASRPEVLEALAVMTPQAGSGGGKEDVDWCLNLLRGFLESGQAPLASLWVAMHFEAFASCRSEWTRPGVLAPSLSPFVYAMQ